MSPDEETQIHFFISLMRKRMNGLIKTRYTPLTCIISIIANFKSSCVIPQSLLRSMKLLYHTK